MPFGIGSLNFIDDAVNSVMNGLDSLFTSDEERKKAKRRLEEVRKELKLKTKAHTRKVLEIHAKDRQNARSAQDVALKKAWWAMPLLMILSFLGFFAVLGALIFLDAEIMAKEPLYIMLGTLGTIVTQIAQFLWGSSVGSKDKDENIRRLMEQASLNETNSGSGSPTPPSKPPTPKFNKKIGTLEPASLSEN